MQKTKPLPILTFTLGAKFGWVPRIPQQLVKDSLYLLLHCCVALSNFNSYKSEALDSELATQIRFLSLQSTGIPTGNSTDGIFHGRAIYIIWSNIPFPSGQWQSEF